MVPALIESIKELGLVLVADTSDEGDSLAVPGLGAQGMYRMPDGVNGVLRGNGVLRFNESIDM
jgi:CDK inhibitor PHO81